jgi:hypothetical protein
LIVFLWFRNWHAKCISLSRHFSQLQVRKETVMRMTRKIAFLAVAMAAAVAMLPRATPAHDGIAKTSVRHESAAVLTASAMRRDAARTIDEMRGTLKASVEELSRPELNLQPLRLVRAVAARNGGGTTTTGF